MRRFSLFALAAALLFNSQSSADYKRILDRKLQLQQIRSERMRAENSDQPSTAVELSFSQKINHDSSSDTRTFTQRYWIDTSLAKDAKSPVLLFLCGEWTCGDELAVLKPFAKMLGAHMVLMEHRYYGKSHPFNSLTAENLQYLSTKNALVDFANIQRSLQSAKGWTGKWIVVGGSYSANLAAYYRLKYPELVAGAWASSAPVEARENFEEYDHHVAKVLAGPCLAAVKEANVRIEAALKSESTKLAVKKMFAAEVLEDDVDFLYLIADMAALAAQYGYKEQLCGALAKTPSDPVQGYANFVKYIFGLFGMDATSGSVVGAMSLDPADYLNSAGRMWYYQSCTEYGYWQNAYRVYAESSRSPRVNQEYHDSICRRLFGVSLKPQTEAMNKEFYTPLFDSSVTRIFFTNGAEDPWMNLSIAPELGNDTNKQTPSYTMANASHCNDLSEKSNPSVIEARKRALTYFTDWLK